MKFVISGILSFLFALAVHPQPSGNFHFQRLGIENGLPDAEITCMEQDDDGFLWIGTANGLSRYDGAEFKNFFHNTSKNSLPGNHINQIQKYDAEHLLISTWTGLSLLNLRTLQFKNFLVPCSSLMFSLENCFQSIAIDKKKNIWAGSKTCLFYLDNKLRVLREFRGFTEKDYNLKRISYTGDIKVLPDNKILVFLQNRDWEGEYFIANGEKGDLQLLRENAGHPLYTLVYLNGVYPTPNKSVDFCFLKRTPDSLIYYDGNLDQAHYVHLRNLPIQSKLKNALLFRLDMTTIAGLYPEGGFSLLSVQRNQTVPTTLPDVQLGDYFVTALKQDKEANLWVGTQNGLFKSAITSKNVSSIFINPVTLIPGFTPELRKIFFIDDSLWICSNSSGFYITTRQLNTISQFSFHEYKDLNTTWSIIKKDEGDTLWFNTQYGIRWYNKKQKTRGKLTTSGKLNVMDSLPITATLTDNKGLIWMGIGFGNGVVYYDPLAKRFTHYSAKTGSNRLPIRYPSAIAEDHQGDLWMGNRDGVGLVRWKRSLNKFELITPQYQSIFDNAIINTLFCERQKVLWIGTYNGLLRYDISSNKFSRFDAPTHLLSGYVNSICQDEKERLWIGTNYGLSCYLLKENRFIHFTHNNVLPEDKINDVTFDKISKKIFVTTDRYLLSFEPEQLLLSRPPLKIQFTRIKINNEEKELVGNYTIGHQQNDLSLFFTAVNLTDGQDNEYFYKINDNNWISIGKQRQLHLTNLAPGHYTVTTKVISSTGQESINKAAINFLITAPFWQTWWFYLLCALVFATIVYNIYRYRVRQILRLQKTRDRIATDLHDDIGSTLTNISILSQLSNNTLHQPQEARQFLLRISEEVHASSQAMDDIIWSVNSRHDSMEETKARMRRYAAELFDRNAVVCHLEFDENSADKKLSMEQRRDIYLIYKESLNNVYKHAKAKNVWVTVRLRHHAIHLIIKDDGQGFRADQPTHRNGLKNLEIRVKKWKGHFTLQSTPGEGTTIEMEMPIKN